MPIITINAKPYDTDLLTKEAREKVNAAQIFNKRLGELQNDVVMARIALNTVVAELEAMTVGKLTTKAPSPANPVPKLPAAKKAPAKNVTAKRTPKPKA